MPRIRFKLAAWPALLGWHQPNIISPKVESSWCIIAGRKKTVFVLRLVPRCRPNAKLFARGVQTQCRDNVIWLPWQLICWPRLNRIIFAVIPTLLNNSRSCHSKAASENSAGFGRNLQLRCCFVVKNFFVRPKNTGLVMSQTWRQIEYSCISTVRVVMSHQDILALLLCPLKL